MPSLKEVKGRINSITSTRKITAAMKMVASAKLHRAQNSIEHLLPYQEHLQQLLSELLSSQAKVESPFVQVRQPKRVAIVAFASNQSLCGSYNSNALKHTLSIIHEYKDAEEIHIYAIGKKLSDALQKQQFASKGDFSHLSANPTFHEASALATSLMQQFEQRQIDRVELVYYHFKNIAVQVPTRAMLLPLSLTTRGNAPTGTDYILEPSAPELLTQLLPKVVRMNLYSTLLDAIAAEHAARTMAMQIATENADEMLQELHLIYNKTRQQAITSALLDMVGGQLDQ